MIYCGKQRSSDGNILTKKVNIEIESPDQPEKNPPTSDYFRLLQVCGVHGWVEKLYKKLVWLIWRCFVSIYLE